MKDFTLIDQRGKIDLILASLRLKMQDNNTG